MPSKAALDELTFSGLDLNDAVEILEFGYDCARSKRKEGTIERCLEK